MTAQVTNRDAGAPPATLKSGSRPRHFQPDRSDTVDGRRQHLTTLRKIAAPQNSSDQSERRQDPNRNSARIPPRISLILKDGILPIPGKLRKYKRCRQGLRLASPNAPYASASHLEKRQNPNRTSASIPPRMYLSLKGGISPIPGKLRNTLRAAAGGCVAVNCTWAGQ
jgi:hypothetical protein